MRKAIALVLVMALVVIARRLGGDATGRFATMALGFVLIVATLVGEAGERLKLPRLTGYLAVGIVFGPSVLALLTQQMTGQLRLVNGVAVALIAFSAGMEIDLPALRNTWRQLVKHGTILVVLVYSGLFGATLAASEWLPITAGQPWERRIAIALMLAAVMASFSPTVVMALLAETRAKGPLADRVLQLVVLGDLAIVLLFTGSAAAARVLDGGGVDVPAAFGHVVKEVLGSFAVGAVVGAIILAYRRFVDQRTGLFIAATCLVLAEVGSRAGLSPLLCCLVAGLVVRNAEPHSTHHLELLVGRVRTPVLVVFFAAAGASLHLGDFGTVALVAVAVVVTRLVLIVTANRIGARFAGLSPQIARLVPNGLVSQAGVTLGLAVIVGREFGAWGQQLETLFVSVIAIHELAGPVAFRWALHTAGEVQPEPVEAEQAAPG